MQMLLTLFKALIIIYLVAWAILLAMCFRKKQFWPIVKNSGYSKYFWLVTFIFLNPALTVLYFIFGQIRSPRARTNNYAFPAVVAFVIVGFIVNFPGITHLWMQPFLGRSADEDKGPYFHAQLAAIKSSDNTSTSSYTSNSNNSRLACRNVVIVCEGEHTLLQRVANSVQEMVEKIPNIETVHYYNQESLPLTLDFTPDIFIHLNLNYFKENLLPYLLKLEVEFQAMISDTAVKSGYSSINNKTPPLINYSLNIEISHRSETTGYESERYNMAAKDIAKQICKELEKNLKNWQGKFGLLPEIPDYFYGKYTPYEMPEPLKSLEAKLLYSYNGLMKNNETILQLNTTGDAVEQLKQLQQQMINLGWKDNNSNLYEEHMETRLEKTNMQLRMKKENRQIYIFKRWGTDSHGLKSITRNTNNEDKEISTRLYVRDVEMLSDKQLQLALDKLFVEPVDIELIMLFDRMYNFQQREKYFQLLQNQPPTLKNLVRLAEMYQSRKMFGEAEQAVLRAAAMLWVTRDEQDLKNRLKSVAKKLGNEKLVDQQPSREFLLEFGFTEITENTEPFEIKVGSDEPMLLFSQDSNGAIQTLHLSCTPSDTSNNAFTVYYTHNQKDGGKSWGSQSAHSLNNQWVLSNEYNFPEDSSLNCHVTSNKDSNRYIMSFEIFKDTPQEVFNR